MRLVLRRTRGARFLLLAAAGATFVAVALITGLTEYASEIGDAGTRAAVLSAPALERAVLVTADAGVTTADLRARDAALRAAVAAGLDGRPVAVSMAAYAVGLEFSGETGTAAPDSTGNVFARAMFLDDLPDHADLTEGAWPRPGAARIEVTLAQAAARSLDAGVGDVVPITDRRTKEVTEVLVVGVWRPRESTDPYWLLTPGVDRGVVAYGASYGPLVAHRDDFLRAWSDDASLGWVLRPDLSTAGLRELARLGPAVRRLAAELPERAGIGDSATVSTKLPQLADRLRRADFVGRSALLTPILLMAVLAGYALLLVALLINEQRRAETALMRARGANRRQLAGLALGEAVLILLPAVGLAPVLAVVGLGYADRLPLLSGAALRLRPTLSHTAFIVAGVAALGCLLAMLMPAARRSGTYVAQLASRVRRERRAAAERVGIDVALVGFALLGWAQLRQYTSPVTGAGDRLGIDPLLAAAPTVAVLAGAVLTLRLLPRLTRPAERYLDRRLWTATTFGIWQAGRRPHAGAVLLLALAVASSTLAWCLAGTAHRSLIDQANHRVGADLRLVETGGVAPAGRLAQVAQLPGVGAVLPVLRDQLRLGARNVDAALVALDSVAAPDVVRYRGDLSHGSPESTFGRLAAARGDLPAAALPADARRLTADLSVRVNGVGGVGNDIRTYAVLIDDHGGLHRLDLGTSGPDPSPRRIDVALPDAGGRPLSLIGFDVATVADRPARYTLELDNLAATTAAGASVEVDLTGRHGWRVVDTDLDSAVVRGGPGSVRAIYDTPPAAAFDHGLHVSYSVVLAGTDTPIPVIATTEALRALERDVGAVMHIVMGGISFRVQVVDEVAAVPGTPAAPALLADLPTLGTAFYREAGIVRVAQEHWAVTDPGSAAAAYAAAAGIPGVWAMDRRAIAAAAATEPYGVGARGALFAAALGALLLAVVGIAVDVRATTRQRMGEMAVLHTLGAGARMRARMLMAEHAFLSAIGVAVGAVVGIAVAASMAPLVILTASGQRPMPAPLPQVPWIPVAATAIGLLAVSVILSGWAMLRQRTGAAQLRIGEDR